MDTPKMDLAYALTVAYSPNFSSPIAFTCAAVLIKCTKIMLKNKNCACIVVCCIQICMNMSLVIADNLE